MAWTLNFLLLAGAIVLVTYLHRTIQKIRRNAFVYPSEAIIDQTLPPEIMEHIFLNLDYSSIMTCSEVSKYWRHHAIKEQIQDYIIRNDTSLRLNFDRLNEALNSETFKLSRDTRRLSYPPIYPPQWRLADQLFAKNLGKELIETDLTGARQIYNALRAKNTAEANSTDIHVNKYLLKLRGRLEYHYNHNWNIRDTGNNVLQINMNEYKDGHKFYMNPREDCEMIVEFNNLVTRSSPNLTSNLLKFRLLDYRPQIAGFPAGPPLVQLAFLFLLPCIIIDYRNSPDSEAKFYASVILHAIYEITGLILAFAGQVPYPGQSSSPEARKKFNIAASITIVLALIGLIFYRWSLELTNYILMLVACTVYFFLWQDFASASYRRAKLVAFILACLIVSMNDWKLTVDAVKNGQIFYTLMYNLLMHLQFGVLITLHSIMLNYFYKSPRTRKQDLFKWRSSFGEMYLTTLIALVFITIYAPTTQTKVFA